jgi:predicted CoA-substrate-specific enzyme activase
MIGADAVRNEITAQATAAAEIDPSVDTIFEIGGQDSKFISLEHGAVVDFEMNKACAAGTGSFLEEQAERLGIRIKQEFEGKALKAASPCRLGERCTVFMESDLVHFMNKGAGVEELTAGLAYSIVHNYLQKVVAGKRVGERIFFQGGVAANKAVVSAFEQVTGKAITVPPHHEVTGAIGAAIIAMREQNGRQSTFKGFDLSKRAYSVKTFECAECANRCTVRKVSFEGEEPLFYGSRCEKYDVRKKSSDRQALPDLFAERERMLLDSPIPEKGRKTIGIPRMLYVSDYLPFWRTFFSELGYRVVLSDRTNRTLVNKGLEATSAETCFPAKVALGHLQDLLDKGVDLLFLPSYIRFPVAYQKLTGTQACPYVQAFPYLARASLNFGNTRTLEPVLHLQDRRHFIKSMGDLGKALGKRGRTVLRAMHRAERAQKEFARSAEARGNEVLGSLREGEKALVLIGRNYNTSDTGLNMNLPAKIRDLGIQALPMDFLPLHDVAMDGLEDMYWRSGQRILAAARFMREHPNLYPVYITNFGCGPDSFITHFFRDEMGDKPYLQLEIDEHSADAGAVTRIEAFLDSLKHAPAVSPPRTFAVRTNGSPYRKKIYLPPMTDHAFAISAAFKACGVEADVLPESDDETLRIGKEHSSGRECYPLALTTGDMSRRRAGPASTPNGAPSSCPRARGPAGSASTTATTGSCSTGSAWSRCPSSRPRRTRPCTATWASWERIFPVSAGRERLAWTCSRRRSGSTGPMKSGRARLTESTSRPSRT